jgi:hypothetical protein
MLLALVIIAAGVVTHCVRFIPEEIQAEMEKNSRALGPITAKKPDLPPKQGVEPSFPVFGFRRPEQKGWTGLKPKAQKLLSDFKTKKRKPATWPSQVARSWPK